MPGERFTNLETARLAVVGRLTSGALHELGNPLVALIGTAELAVASAEEGSRLRRRLELIDQTANEIAEVVRALQRVTRVADGEPATRVDLAVEAVAALELVQRLGPGRAGRLESTLPGGETPAVARPGALLVALAGLLVGALESTSGDIVVRLVVSQAGGSAAAWIGHAEASADARALADAAGGTVEERDAGVALVLPSAG